ncbi:MAG TPA: hypothetical protein VGM30_03070 [Puia sp.]|jgi:hypothetical protein
MGKAKKKSPAKKKAATKEKPLHLDMSFEEAIRLSIQTKVPKKKK